VTGQQPTAPRYPVRTRLLHWLTAALIFTALFLGFTMVNSLDNYTSLVRVHMTVGVIILSIVVLRAANRFTHRMPKMPDTVGVIEHDVMVGSEVMLYSLMFAQPLVGWAMVSASGKPVVILGSLRLPRIAPFDADLYFVLRQIHFLLAYALMAVVAMHICAVLWHTLALRDGMLSRMTLPARRRETGGKSRP
jgi:cytochrome b561